MVCTTLVVAKDRYNWQHSNIPLVFIGEEWGCYYLTD